MKKILISGLINIETTVPIGNFPIEYSPIDYKFFGIESTVSGVGYNIAKAVKTLGDEPVVLSLIGNDMYKESISSEFEKSGIKMDYVQSSIDNTAQSTILYDENGRRKIVLDLKDVQDRVYDKEIAKEAIKNVDIAVICNINFARGLLDVAKQENKIIATDVHVVNDINDEYNKDFMENSDILFLSNENILGHEKEFVQNIVSSYDNKIVVVGMGKEGALMYVNKDKKFVKYKAIDTRKIVSTIGAGDALFSAFIHFYAKDANPYEALQNAIYFASYKIGEKGAASGFLTEEDLLKLRK
ncbi:MAG: carbohydrate kinase family protein [Clostridiaceae bacterium]|nr:carbohydrate kinase family protein [Clostridiaceae bacterium]